MGVFGSKSKKVEPETGGEPTEPPEEGETKAVGGFFSAFRKKEFVDPPMPNIGKFVDFDRLQTRKKNVKHTMKTMFKVIDNDTTRSVNIGTTIPVSEQLERVKITDPVIDLIKARKSKKEDRQFVKDNLLESQRYLSLRRSSIDMMNHNYDDKTVRELELVYTEEARAQITFKEESHIKEEEGKDEKEEFEPYSDTESMMSVEQNKKNKKKK
jgi:hypothetical protein